jgi:hypothetical protein
MTASPWAYGSLSMARHRAELLLGPDGKPPARDPVEDHWTAAARDQLAEEFLASPHATEFTDTASRNGSQALDHSQP